MSDALTAAAEVQGHLPGIAVDVVGDVRRGIEVVDVVELVAASDDPEQALDRFVASQAMVVERREPGFVEARLLEGARVRLWSVATAARAAALQRLTGSVEHNRAVDIVATRAGFTIALDGVRRASTLVAVADEPALYELLRLQFVAPTLRSGDSEVQEAAEARLPRLITADDIQGMVHCHTTYSDGRNTVLEMARAAQERGMKYITITDHSPTAFYARGVEIDRLRRQWEEIAAAQEQVTIRILRGTESDILKDGALDYPDAILDQLDVIIASIHSRYLLDKKRPPRRASSPRSSSRASRSGDTRWGGCCSIVRRWRATSSAFWRSPPRSAWPSRSTAIPIGSIWRRSGRGGRRRAGFRSWSRWTPTPRARSTICATEF